MWCRGDYRRFASGCHVTRHGRRTCMGGDESGYLQPLCTKSLKWARRTGYNLVFFVWGKEGKCTATQRRDAPCVGPDTTLIYAVSQIIRYVASTLPVTAFAHWHGSACGISEQEDRSGERGSKRKRTHLSFSLPVKFRKQNYATKADIRSCVGSHSPYLSNSSGVRPILCAKTCPG